MQSVPLVGPRSDEAGTSAAQSGSDELRHGGTRQTEVGVSPVMKCLATQLRSLQRLPLSQRGLSTSLCRVPRVTYRTPGQR